MRKDDLIATKKSLEEEIKTLAGNQNLTDQQKVHLKELQTKLQKITKEIADLP